MGMVWKFFFCSFVSYPDFTHINVHTAANPKLTKVLIWGVPIGRYTLSSIYIGNSSERSTE